MSRRELERAHGRNTSPMLPRRSPRQPGVTAGAILVAAGRSSRMGFDKLWADLGGEPVLAHALRMLASAGLNQLVMVVSAERMAQAHALLERLQVAAEVCAGGERRRDSVAIGLARLGRCEWIVVHDAARPFATSMLIQDGLRTALATGAAVAAIPMADTTKWVRDGVVVETLPREEVWRVQTPQVFRRVVLERALAFSNEDVGDEATLVERMGGSVRVFPGTADNLKLTTPEDLHVAAAMLSARRRVVQ